MISKKRNFYLRIMQEKILSLLRTGEEGNIQGEREYNTKLLVGQESMHLQDFFVWGNL